MRELVRRQIPRPHPNPHPNLLGWGPGICILTVLVILMWAFGSTDITSRGLELGWEAGRKMELKDSSSPSFCYEGCKPGELGLCMRTYLSSPVVGLLGAEG